MTRPATLVTGASSGLGAEFARQCAARGDEVVLAARRGDRLGALACDIGARAHVVVTDLSEPGAAAALLEEVGARGFHVQTLVNNAGFGLVGRFGALPLGRQREMIDLNIAAPVELAHIALADMRARGTGAILNVASTGAFQAGPGFAVYFATKAFLLSFSEALHEELRGAGIRVSCLCPGPTRTEFGAVAGMTGRGFDAVSADAASVVAAGLAGLDRGRAIVIPGLANKATAHGNRFVPRALVRRIVAGLKL